MFFVYVIEVFLASPELAQYINDGYFGCGPSDSVWMVPGTWGGE